MQSSKLAVNAFCTYSLPLKGEGRPWRKKQKTEYIRKKKELKGEKESEDKVSRGLLQFKNPKMGGKKKKNCLMRNVIGGGEFHFTTA